jgi:hypothetical protein
MNAASLPHSISRREVLKFGGLIVSFALPMPLTAAGKNGKTAAGDQPKTVAPDRVDGFLAIDGHGNITVFSGKVDLGTGVRTAITQIAADELDVPMARVNVIQGDTLLTPDQGPPTAVYRSKTAGCKSDWQPLRHAAPCCAKRLGA